MQEPVRHSAFAKWDTGRMTSVKMTSDPLDLGDNLWVAESFCATTSIQGSEATVEIDVVFSDEAGRYLVDRVSAHRGPAPTEEITGALLREIRVQEIIQQSALGVVWFSDPRRGMISSQWGLTFMRRVSTVDGRAQPEHVTTAARIYRIATIVGLPPLRTVAEKLGISQSTATRLISKAREAGQVLVARAPGSAATAEAHSSAFESLTLSSSDGSPDVWVDLWTVETGGVRVRINGQEIDGTFASREAALEAIHRNQEKVAQVYGDLAPVGSTHGDD